MSETTKKQRLGAYDQAVEHWEKTYAQNLANERPVYNRSGIEIDPLYLPDTDPPLDYVDRLGLPGQTPYTRGIYSTMHRGRTWSQRQLIGLGTPAEYNRRVMKLLDAGTTAISLIPCNSVYRGNDCDEVPLPLLCLLYTSDAADE